MISSHKIKNAVFELRFSSRTALLRENSSLGGFVRQSLMPVVDDVLSQHDLLDKVIYIDSLKIDLGRFHLSDFKGMMKRQLRSMLDALLKSKIRDLQQESSAQERIVSQTRNNLELIEHFLMNGTLPNSIDLKKGLSLNRRVQLILQQEQSAFIKFLKKTRHRPQVVRRLVRQFPTGTVREVARRLAAGQATTALKAVDDILYRIQRRSSSARQTPALTELIWELLLEYLLQNPDSRFTAANFVDWIARKAEGHSFPAAESVTTALIEVVQELPPPKNLASPSIFSLEAIASNTAKRRIFKGYDLYEALRFYSRHGMIPWSTEIILPDISVTKIIKALRTSYPEMLVKFAKDLAYRPDCCQSLAEKLAPSALREFFTALLKVTSPENAQNRMTFIQSITEFADRAADPKVYYSEILHDLVTQRPIDLKQIIAHSAIPQQTLPQKAAIKSTLDPDLVRSYLTAMLKADKKTDINGLSFSKLLDDLETKYPVEYREYLAWLTANEKRFGSFLKLIGSKKLKKGLTALAPFPATVPTIEILEKVFDSEVESVSSNRDDATALIRYLTGDPASPVISETTARVIFERLIRQGSKSLYTSLLENFKHNGTVKKMIMLLSENWLTRALAGLWPNYHLPVQTYADVISVACYSEESLKPSAEISRLKWEFVFSYLAENWDRPLNESDFILRFIAFLADKANKSEASTLSDILATNLTAHTQIHNRNEKLAAKQVLKLIESNPSFSPRPAAQISDTSLRVISPESKEAGMSGSASSEAPRQDSDPSHPKPAGSEGSAENKHHAAISQYALESEPTESSKIEHPAYLRAAFEEQIEEVVVHNAGLVIAAPYLPQLWNMLGLIEGGQFNDLQAAGRAVHLLQFMVDEDTESPEFQLALNKMLCGINLSEPVLSRIDIAKKEREAIEGLIRGMIANWKTIGQTSVAGFRESFFQRRGRLTQKDDAWHLKVEQRAFDMLLNSIPWGFTTFKHPWMQRVVHVKWR